MPGKIIGCQDVQTFKEGCAREDHWLSRCTCRHLRRGVPGKIFGCQDVQTFKEGCAREDHWLSRCTDI
jgi:hypothetical protein